MIISQTEISIPNAQHVSVSDEALTVELEDGRTLSAPLGWYPRLAHAKPSKRGQGHIKNRYKIPESNCFETAEPDSIAF